jgi:hypothetical protein
MNETTPTQQTEFVVKRLTEAFTVGGADYPLALWLLLAGGVGIIGLLHAAFTFASVRGKRGASAAFVAAGVRVVVYAVISGLFLLPIPLRNKEFPAWVWLAVLIPILLIGLIYIVFMYRKDAISVGWAWASLLGCLRASVYGVLAYVFLLPAIQSWERAEKNTKVIIALDVSASVTAISDDLPGPEQKPSDLPTRFAKVVKFLTDDQINFIQRLTGRNPVTVYRVGARLDEEAHTFAVKMDRGERWSADDWQRWAKLDLKDWLLTGLSDTDRRTVRLTEAFGDQPGTLDWGNAWMTQKIDTAIPAALSEEGKKKLTENRGKLERRMDVLRQFQTGTNLGDSLVTLINREASNMISGIIVISDGHSNQGADTSLAEFRNRAAREKIPVFTIAIGEERHAINIRITDVQTPERTAPDEKFVVRVEVDGEGLADQDVPVFLDLYKPGADKPSFTLPEVRIKFAPGETPHAQAEFQIDPEKLPDELKAEGTANKELLEGEWKVIARVPKDAREAFAGIEHTSDATPIVIIKKPLRVLLFAGGPTREYQFLRTLLVREKDAKRAELSIFLQNLGRDGNDMQDVEPERRLGRFPTFLRTGDDPKEKLEERYYNLDKYDLVIAFDPDWSELTPEQLNMLQRWVEYQAGGLILVGGPINTFQLARGDDGGKIRALLDLFPVIPGDSVLQTGTKRSTKKGYRLNFPGAEREMDFLKLDDDSSDLLAGWEAFFTGFDKREEGRDREVQRGFFNYYPIQELKPGATAVAVFGDPQAQIAASTGQPQPHPYIVTSPFGKGRVVFLAAGEFWRLRQYKESFYERFWTKLGRYASAGTRVAQNRRGVLVMGRQFTAGGYIRLEAQLFGAAADFLPEMTRPKFTVTTTGPDGDKNPRKLELTPKKSAAGWAGWFQSKFVLATPGEYQLELSIPDSSEVLRGKFQVKASNPELDNARPDLNALFGLASGVSEVQARPGVRFDDLRKKLNNNPYIQYVDRSAKDNSSRDGQRLFFDLPNADIIPDCMDAQTKVFRLRGPIDDRWDKGAEFGTDQRGKPIMIANWLWVIVGLLSVEWLIRKLLRLA